MPYWLRRPRAGTFGGGSHNPQPTQHRSPPVPSAPAILDAAEVAHLDQCFGKLRTEEILAWAWEKFGARAAIGTSFQGAGLVMIHLAKLHQLPFPVFTLDTGLLFPETLALKKRLEDFFGFQIESFVAHLPVEEQGDNKGPQTW